MDADRLAAIPIFAELPPEELAAVAEFADELDVGSRGSVVSEGDFGHAIFAVESGTAEVIIDGVHVGHVGPGDVVGEIAVLASGRRTATVTATSPMHLITFFKRDVWALERRAPEAARRLRHLLEERAGAADDAPAASELLHDAAG